MPLSIYSNFNFVFLSVIVLKKRAYYFHSLKVLDVKTSPENTEPGALKKMSGLNPKVFFMSKYFTWNFSYCIDLENWNQPNK